MTAGQQFGRNKVPFPTTIFTIGNNYVINVYKSVTWKLIFRVTKK